MPRVAALLLVLFASIAARAGEVQVAAASNLAGPIQRIAAAFKRDTGNDAIVALGSTGKLHAQIRNGAPFEVLLAADAETPRKLEAELIHDAVRECRGNVMAAAKMLGISRATVYRKLGKRPPSA